jgi:hypothetical protein
MFHLPLLDGAVASGTGGESFKARAETVSLGYPPTVFRDFGAPEGTTDRLLMVDGKVGTILRATARLEGREYYVAEVAEVPHGRGSRRAPSGWRGCPAQSSSVGSASAPLASRQQTGDARVGDGAHRPFLDG